MNEEDTRIFMRLCPYQKSTFKTFLKKLKKNVFYNKLFF